MNHQSNSNKLTRRDWFRLKKPHQNRWLSAKEQQGKPDEQGRETAELASQTSGQCPTPPPSDDNATSQAPTPARPAREQNAMEPVASPINHAGMDLSELPHMREAELGRQDITDLFEDLGKLASNVTMRQRLSQPGHSIPDDPQPIHRRPIREQLTTAKQALFSGNINRLQIRYDWDGCHWIDTLERSEAGYRLLRIQHQRAQGNPSKV